MVVQDSYQISLASQRLGAIEEAYHIRLVH